MKRELAWVTDRATGELLAVAVVLIDGTRILELPAVRADQELHVAGVRWTTPAPA